METRDWAEHPVGRLFSSKATLRRIACDFFLSRQCHGCGADLHHGDPGVLCWECRARLPLMAGAVCAVCGDYVNGLVGEGFVCEGCGARRPAYDWARSAMHYDGAVQEIVKALKYEKQFACIEEMALWMLTAWTDSSRPPTPVPPTVATGVPMAYLRERTRGYNQANLLAREVAAGLGIGFQAKLLKRVRSTVSQTRMTAKQRRQNVKGVFAVAKPKAVEGASVLLVDDVMTTGSTLAECAAALKAAGAAHVYCLTAARGG